MERRTEFNPEADDLPLAEMDEGRDDPDGAVPCAGADELIEGVVVGRPAIRVAGAILLDRADKDGCRAEDLGPTDGGGKKVRVAEGDVGDGNFGPGAVGRSLIELGLAGVRGRGGDGDGWVGKGGAADAAEEAGTKGKEVAETDGGGHGLGGAELAGLGALAIADV